VTAPIRVLVCDDQMLVRTGLVTIIDAQPDLEVAGECGDGRTAVDARQLVQPVAAPCSRTTTGRPSTGPPEQDTFTERSPILIFSVPVKEVLGDGVESASEASSQPVSATPATAQHRASAANVLRVMMNSWYEKHCGETTYAVNATDSPLRKRHRPVDTFV
jgi:DNA-binding NarL/FixJ family response regulator